MSSSASTSSKKEISSSESTPASSNKCVSAVMPSVGRPSASSTRHRMSSRRADVRSDVSAVFISSLMESDPVEIEQDALGAHRQEVGAVQDRAYAAEVLALPDRLGRRVVQVPDDELREELARADLAVRVHLHPVRDGQAPAPSLSGL